MKEQKHKTFSCLTIQDPDCVETIEIFVTEGRAKTTKEVEEQVRSVQASR